MPFNWIKKNITIGNIINFVWMVIVGTFIVAGVYHSTINRVENVEATDREQTNKIDELNQRMYNLNKRMQDQINQDTQRWQEFIERLDDRYVNQTQFEDFQDRIGVQLQYIREDTQYMRERIDDR